MSTVFVSHESSSIEETKLVTGWLRDLGYGEVLFVDNAPGGLTAGEWFPQLLHRLATCNVLVAVVTKSWSESRMCFYEAMSAIRSDAMPVLLRFDKAPLSSELKRLQWFDVAGAHDMDAKEKLRRALASRLPPEEAFALQAGRSPYPGANPFGEDDAGIFAGRATEIGEARRRVERMGKATPGAARLLLLTGPAGSGKSSLLRAGLLARLARLPGFAPRPLEVTGLPEALDGVAHDKVPVFGLDQLEDADLTSGGGVVAPLARLLACPRPLVVVGTLRPEQVGQLRESFNEESPSPGFEVLPLAQISRAMLSAAIRAPLKAMQDRVIDIEDALVEHLIAETLPGGSGGGMSLLAEALRLAWSDPTRGTVLSLNGFQALGGLAAAAGAALIRLRPQLTSEDWAAIRDALIPGLIGATDTGGFRRLTRFTPDKPPCIDWLLRARVLAEAEDGSVRLVHEDLLKLWPELRQWLAEDGPALTALANLEGSATAWAAGFRGSRHLRHNGVSLEDASVLAQNTRFATEISTLGRTYLEACVAAEAAAAAPPPPLPTDLGKAISILLDSIEALQFAACVRLSDADCVLAALLDTLELVSPALDRQAAARLFARVDLAVARLKEAEGEPQQQEAAVRQALARFDITPAGFADPPLEFEAVCQLAEAAYSQHRFDLASGHLNRAKALLPKLTAMHAMRYAGRRARLLRHLGKMDEACRTARRGLLQAGKMPLGNRLAGFLHAETLRQLAAAAAEDHDRAGHKQESDESVGQAFDILEAHRLSVGLGKMERQLRATLIHNRAAAHKHDGGVGSELYPRIEADYEEAIAGMRELLDTDPADRLVREDMTHYLWSCFQLRAHLQDSRRAAELGAEALQQMIHLSAMVPGNRRWHDELHLGFGEYFEFLLCDPDDHSRQAAELATSRLEHHGASLVEGGHLLAKEPGFRLWLQAGLAALHLGCRDQARKIATVIVEQTRDDPLLAETHQLAEQLLGFE